MAVRLRRGVGIVELIKGGMGGKEGCTVYVAEA